MRKWTMRLLGTAGLVAAMQTGAFAGPPAARVAADVNETTTFRAATPYNATVMSRTTPNPALNHPNFALDCENANQNFDKYVHGDCWGGRCGGKHGCGRSTGCDSGCGNSCGAIFNRHSFGRGNGCCESQSCGRDRGCAHEGCGRQSCSSCDSGCGSPCRAIFQRPDFNFGRSKCCSQPSCNSCDTGCNSGCTNGGCSHAAPAAAPAVPPAAPPAPMPPAKPVGVKPIGAAPTDSDIQPVGFWLRLEKDPAPVPACESCPQHGPAPKRRLPTPASLNCTGCSTWNSEYVFFFGSCRQFFGEPTHDWFHKGQ